MFQTPFMDSGISLCKNYFAAYCGTLQSFVMKMTTRLQLLFSLEQTNQIYWDRLIKGPVGGLLQLTMSKHRSFTFTAQSTMLVPRLDILLYARPVELMLDCGYCMDYSFFGLPVSDGDNPERCECESIAIPLSATHQVYLGSYGISTKHFPNLPVSILRPKVLDLSAFCSYMPPCRPLRDVMIIWRFSSCSSSWTSSVLVLDRSIKACNAGLAFLGSSSKPSDRIWQILSKIGQHLILLFTGIISLGFTNTVRLSLCIISLATTSIHFQQVFDNTWMDN